MDTPAAETPAQRGSTILTRTLYVNVTGSLANLAMQGPSAGTWKLVDGKGISVFGMGAEVDTQASPPLVCFLRGPHDPRLVCRWPRTSCGRR